MWEVGPGGSKRGLAKHLLHPQERVADKKHQQNMKSCIQGAERRTCMLHRFDTTESTRLFGQVVREEAKVLELLHLCALGTEGLSNNLERDSMQTHGNQKDF